MALVKACDIMKMADQGGYAALGFDAFNLESIMYIMETAVELNAPSPMSRWCCTAAPVCRRTRSVKPFRWASTS